MRAWSCGSSPSTGARWRASVELALVRVRAPRRPLAAALLAETESWLHPATAGNCRHPATAGLPARYRRHDAQVRVDADFYAALWIGRRRRVAGSWTPSIHWRIVGRDDDAHHGEL